MFCGLAFWVCIFAAGDILNPENCSSNRGVLLLYPNQVEIASNPHTPPPAQALMRFVSLHPIVSTVDALQDSRRRALGVNPSCDLSRMAVYIGVWMAGEVRGMSIRLNSRYPLSPSTHGLVLRPVV
jgi:hypothetical protein